jgi:hypothetical protein
VDKKTIRDWFIFMCLLLFLPKDSKLAFDYRPQDWYGELRLSVGGRLLIIGKNSNADAVELGLNGIATASAIQGQQPNAADVTGRGLALPNSITIIDALRTTNDETRRRAYIGGKYYFTPGPLNILTRADLYNTYLLLAFVIALFMVLGFLVARYADEDFALPGKASPRTEPTTQ